MEFQGTAISVSVSGSSTVYIACGENRDGGLRAPLLQAGWTEVDGSISTSCCELPSIFRCDFCAVSLTDVTLTHSGTPGRCYRLDLVGEQDITLPATSSSRLVSVIVVVEKS